jgi:hypothetical protein
MTLDARAIMAADKLDSLCRTLSAFSISPATVAEATDIMRQLADQVDKMAKERDGLREQVLNRRRCTMNGNVNVFKHPSGGLDVLYSQWLSNFSLSCCDPDTVLGTLVETFARKAAKLLRVDITDWQWDYPSSESDALHGFTVKWKMSSQWEGATARTLLENVAMGCEGEGSGRLYEEGT